jgi:hypothetical protein
MDARPVSAPPLLDEWKECRNTIGRLDTILADNRKYGFPLVTLLLSANAVIPTTSLLARIAVAIAVMILIVVLFIIDRYYWILMRAAVVRAVQLEYRMGSEALLTKHLGQFSLMTNANLLAFAVYCLFVGSAAFVVAVPTWSESPTASMVALLVALTCVLLMRFISRRVATSAQRNGDTESTFEGRPPMPRRTPSPSLAEAPQSPDS